jgi:hypothetical protein
MVIIGLYDIISGDKLSNDGSYGKIQGEGLCGFCQFPGVGYIGVVEIIG